MKILVIIQENEVMATIKPDYLEEFLATNQYGITQETLKFKEHNLPMESDLSTCRKCGLTKVRIADGKFDARNKRYVDENGKLWSGRTCADCNRQRIREAMKNARLKKKAQPDPQAVP